MCLICYGVTAGATGLGGLFAPAPEETPRLPISPPATVQSVDDASRAAIPFQRTTQTSVLVGTACAKPGLKREMSEVSFICKKKGKKVVWVRKQTNKAVRSDTRNDKPAAVEPSSTGAAQQVEPTITDRSLFAMASDCMLGGPWPADTENIGFPRGKRFAPALGNRKALVVFVHFPDVPSDSRQIQEWKAHQIPNAELAYQTMSFGKYSLRFEYKEKFFLLKEASSTYTRNYSRLIQDSVAEAAKEIDLSLYDFVNVVTPPTDNIPDEGAVGWSGGIGTMGPITEYLDSPTKRNWLTHETGHVLGLMHGYDYGSSPLGAWDVMSNSFGLSDDLLGWNKFKLGWLDSGEIDCLNRKSDDESIHRLSAIGSKNQGTKLVVVRLNDTEALGVELRHRTAIDKVSDSDEGVLAYLIDTKVQSGKGAFRIISNPSKFGTGTNGNRVLVGTMKRGEQTVFAGVKVRVIHEGANGTYVAISNRGGS